MDAHQREAIVNIRRSLEGQRELCHSLRHVMASKDDVIGFCLDYAEHMLNLYYEGELDDFDIDGL